MLHAINLPGCRPAFEWIVQLQIDLFTALCDPNIGADDITVEWITARRPDISEEWLTKFCGWVKEKVSILERLQNIAALPDITKTQLLQHFNNNLRYEEAFNPAQTPPATTQLQENMPDAADKKYRAFLVIFYDPVFYKSKGYPVTLDGNGGADTIFHKDVFLEDSHTVNDDIRVCPLCDGALDGSQVDHWLAKKHFPELSCHPHNLIEICQACNNGSNKGQKLALNNGNARPFDDWFHPYLRQASGKFTIQIQPKGIPQLQGGNAQDMTRLANLDSLINLQSRWTTEYKTQVKRIQKKISGKKKRGTVFDNHSLKTLIDDWCDDVRDEIGLKPNAIVEESVLALASDVTSHLFEEFSDYATG